MSQSYGAPDDPASIATLHRALDLGVNFWDTANVYGVSGAGGFGANERLLGEVLATRHDEVTIASKVGMVDIERTSSGNRLRLNAHPDEIRRRCDESLMRLNVDCIDLYYLHRVDPDIPIEDSVGAMGDLVSSGKVRYLGVSEVTADELERAHMVHPISALQSKWSLWAREIEIEVLPAARRLGIGIVPFAPLGHGFLTGALAGRSFSGDDSRSRMTEFSHENRAFNETLLAAITEISATHSATPGQIALAWLHQQGDDVVPIPGTKRIEYLEQNAASITVRLTEDEMRRLASR